MAKDDETTPKAPSKPKAKAKPKAAPKPFKVASPAPDTSKATAVCDALRKAKFPVSAKMHAVIAGALKG